MRGREHSALGVLTDMSDMVELAIAATIQRYTGRRKSMRVDYTLYSAESDVSQPSGQRVAGHRSPGSAWRQAATLATRLPGMCWPQQPGQPSRLHPGSGAVTSARAPARSPKTGCRRHPLACRPSRFTPATRRPGMTHHDEQSMRRRTKSTHIEYGRVSNQRPVDRAGARSSCYG